MNWNTQFRLAGNGFAAAAISTLCTAPLAPFIVLTVLSVGDIQEFRELAHPFCIGLGTLIATGVGLFMSVGILFPLTLAFQKFILGQHHKKVFLALLTGSLLLTLIAYFSGAMESTYPSSPVYELGLTIAAFLLQVLGTSIFFSLFRMWGLKVKQKQAAATARTSRTRPRIRARIRGIHHHCRVGKQWYPEPIRETNFPLPTASKNYRN